MVLADMTVEPFPLINIVLNRFEELKAQVQVK
jgi:hypothetical protein